MSLDISKLPYRLNVGICLINKDGKVFAGERFDTLGAWQMPQGGIDEGENVESTAFRELYEETGIKNAEIIEISPTKLSYEFPEELQKILWGARYRGQIQTWIAMKFTGKDSEIDLQAYDEPEFSQWQWFEFDDLIDNIVPFKKETYRQVRELFAPHFKNS